MAVRPANDDLPEAPDGAAASRPAPTRQNAKKKQPGAGSKGRRKAGNASGGIHLRANKRMSW